MRNNILEAHHIEKQYDGHKALSDLSLSIPRGSIYGLLGPNGAGKTSFIRIINQITAPDSGELLFNGQPIAPSDIHRIGYLPEERGLYKKMSVGEQAMYLAKLKGLSSNDAKAKLKSWFEKFEIESWWNKKIEELSKGMAQKVQFIVTVLHEPELLIFDEPFTGFDPINTQLIKEEIKNLNQRGATIIFSTHRMESVEEICDHIALINKSQKILEGPLQSIRDEYRSNTFRVTLKNSSSLELPEGYTTSESQINGEELNQTIQLPDGASANDLLRILIEKGEITHFEEVIPSVNDIFIRNVQNA